MKAKDLKKKVSAQPASLGKVLDRNKKIKIDVERSAIALTSVNKVLKQGHKAIIPVETLTDALTKNEVIEHKVAQAADDLHQVNAELTSEVAERENIEATLAEVRQDLLKSQAKEQEARKFALHDPLTSLPNRMFFEQGLEQGIIQAKRHAWRLAVLFIDINNFKRFNDQYGHFLGDKVLLMLAKRLQASVRAEDTVSRWGGDEFACLLLEVKQEAAITRLADKMGKRIARPWESKGVVHTITASIGIAIYPTAGESAELLFKNADTAMYKAKRTRKGVWLFRETR